MADLIAYSVGVDDHFLIIDGTDGAYSGYAKLFYVPTGYDNVTSISFKLKRQYDPEGAVAEIYTLDEYLLPTGSPLKSVGLPEISTDSYEWYSIDFDISLSTKTWYAVAIRSTTAWDPMHYIFWMGQTFPPDQENTGGEPEYFNLVWQSTGGDVSAQIKIYGDSAEPPGKAQNPTPADDQEGIIITGTDKLKKLQWEAPA